VFCAVPLGTIQKQRSDLFFLLNDHQENVRFQADFFLGHTKVLFSVESTYVFLNNSSFVFVLEKEQSGQTFSLKNRLSFS
jgi:hypothetical protein